jgi:hypothetical protein
MAITTTPANRVVVGWLIVLAALAALTINVLILAGPFEGFIALSEVNTGALTIAFLLVAISKRVGVFARITYAISAIGWGILTVGLLLPADSIYSDALALALVGTLLSGIVGMIRSVYGRGTDDWFLLATIITAVVLYNDNQGLPPPIVGLVIGMLYAALILLAGTLIALRK